MTIRVMEQEEEDPGSRPVATSSWPKGLGQVSSSLLKRGENPTHCVELPRGLWASTGDGAALWAIFT